MLGRKTGAALALAMVIVPASAHAESAETPSIEWQISLVTDAVGISRDTGSGVRALGLLDAGADISLDKVARWSGAVLRVRGLSSFGGRPNDLALTAQGIDNIEVDKHRIRLFELYLEQAFAGDRASVRLGLSDLNSEFYATEASTLLVSPAFGIGSELSATGPNGPSIYPATALTGRLRYHSDRGVYFQAAAVNAQTGLLGERGAARPLFGKGALLIAEAGTHRAGTFHAGMGAWTYTSRQPDLRDTDAAGRPVARRAFGIYALLQKRLAGSEERNVTAFARAGLSDGKTSPYAGGWQAGLLVSRPFAGRPESRFSIGINQGFMTGRFVLNAQDEGRCGHRKETGVELTYADKIAGALTVQPFVQINHNADHEHDARHTFVYALRLRVEFTPR
ncbi:carbohydrate porin [Novosphingobium sp. MW5]|nr:carbohydrate porin [Novosphingobium sp. MW5]